MNTLTHRQGRRTYDRIGSRQDTQGFYEDPATARLLRHGDFTAAVSVFEFGCGTGRFALRLLEEYLPADARYRGVDLSPKMVRLSRDRLARYAVRAEVILTDGDPPTGEADGSCDRFVSTCVFDLLSPDDIRATLRQAHRMLRPNGLLCLVGISGGTTPVSRMVMGIVSRVQSVFPALVGGCRPLDLASFLPPSEWRVGHDSKLVAFGIASEILVAKRCQGCRQGIQGRSRLVK